MLDQTLILELSWSWALCGNDAHDRVSKLCEESALVGFSHIITNHVSGGTPFHREIFFTDLISYKLVSNVDVLGTFAAGGFAIFLHENGTFVVLVDNIVLNPITLRFHKIPSP